MSRRVPAAIVVALLALAAPPASRADSPEQTFDAACRAYEQGRWDEAADGFRGLLRYGFQDPRLEYNLGNAEYKRGHMGEAILHYERARRLDPADRDTAANLAMARAKIRDVVEEDEAPGLLRALRGAQDRTGVNVQAMLLLVGVWLIAGIVTYCGGHRGGFTPAWGWTLAGVVFCTGLTYLSWHTTWRRLEGTPRAVILKPSVEALAGPGANNASLFTLHEGTTAVVLGEREGWLQVSLPNGPTGWVVGDAAERI